MTDTIRLQAAGMAATISPLGAQLLQLSSGDSELLWTPDPAIWDGTAQILFPVVGRVENDLIRVGDQVFTMPMHGFAKDMAFAVVEHAPASCALELTSSPATERFYPFPFTLRLTYSLTPTGLLLAAEIHNPGDTPLPASFGFHPGFRWPLLPSMPKDRHRLVFPDDAELIYTRPQNRQLGPDRFRLPLESGVLHLTESLFEASGLIILDPASRSLRFETDDGSAAIELSYQEFGQLILWMRPGNDFLCIEPCRGHADPIGYAGDFADKPGTSLIAPGETLRLSVGITPHFR